MPVEQLGGQRVRAQRRVRLARRAAATSARRSAAPVQPEGGRRRCPGRRPAGRRRAGRAAGAAAGRAARRRASGAPCCPLPSHARSGARPSLVTCPVQTRSQTAVGRRPPGSGTASSGRSWRTRSVSAPRNQAPPPPSAVEDGLVQRRVRGCASAGGGSVRSATRGGVQRDQPVVPGERAVPRPDDLARGGQLVEHRGAVVGDAGGQDVGLERRRRHDRPGQLLDDARDAVDPAQGAGRGARARPPDRLHALPARAGRRRAPAGRPARPRPAARRATGDAASAARRRRRTRRRCRPSTSGRSRPCTSTPAALEPAQGLGDDRDAPAEPRGGLGRRERPVRAGVPAQEVAHRVGHDLGEHLGHADRQRDAERVPQPSGVLDGGPLLGALGRHARRAGPGSGDGRPRASTSQSGDLVARPRAARARRPPTR